jgi:hypothetical protein
MTLLQLRTHSDGSFSVRSQLTHLTLSRTIFSSFFSTASAFMATPFVGGSVAGFDDSLINIRAIHPDKLEEAF